MSKRNYLIATLLINCLGSGLWAETPRLDLIWETDTVFSYPECVVHDPVKAVLYVSNIGETPEGNPENGDGFVSVLGLDGKLIDKHYITDLNDPKGMDIWKRTLWINDRVDIVEWNLNSDRLIKRHKPDDIVFLNDIGVGPKGEVYSNDADGHKVMMLDGDRWKVFWQDPDKGRPNGILVEADRLLLAMNWSHQLLAMDRKTRERTLLLDGIGAGDGIQPVGNGDYLVTNYLGQVFYLSSNGESEVLLDTRDEKLTADLVYIPEQRLVVIPRHKNHTVAAYRLVKQP